MTENKNNAKKTKQNDAAAMNEGEGADIVPAIQAAVEAQQARQKQQGLQGPQKPQEPSRQEQHEQQGTADDQQKEQEGAFQLDLTQEVREAREGAASLRPVEGGTLTRNELQKPMLHLEWDSVDYVWQRTEVIGYLKDKRMLGANGL